MLHLLNIHYIYPGVYRRHTTLCHTHTNHAYGTFDTAILSKHFLNRCRERERDSVVKLHDSHRINYLYGCLVGWFKNTLRFGFFHCFYHSIVLFHFHLSLFLYLSPPLSPSLSLSLRVYVCAAAKIKRFFQEMFDSSDVLAIHLLFRKEKKKRHHHTQMK